ncbi:MAG: YARHG domain-containing protein [Clostridia bacterium]|nr:YARHG domain-containing protein [Clostridia bacterium]
MEENQNANSEVTKTSYKGIIIFLIVFGIVAVTLTAMLANSAKNANANTNPEEVITPNASGESVEQIEEVVAVKDKKYAVAYDDMYFTNNIKLIEKTYISGEFIKKEEYSDVKYYEETADYIQIDGLKDEEVERKINQKIFDKMFEMLRMEDSRKIKYVDMSARANYSNILSLHISCRFFDNQMYEENSRFENQYLNIDLSTGDDIKFEDLFLDGASVKNILSESIYSQQQSMSEEWWGYSEYILAKTGKEYWDYNYDTVDEELKRLGLMTYEEWESWFSRSSFEENTFKIMHDYTKGNLDFYIDEYSINVYADDVYSCYINLRDNLESLALYKRYMKEESIFDDKYMVAKEGMCGFYIDNYMKTERVMDNLFLSNHMYISDDYRYPNYYREIHENKLAAEKEYALVNPDKMYILGLYSDSSSAYSVKVELDKEEFEKNKNAILKTYSPYWMYDWEGDSQIVSEEVLKELGIKYVYSGGNTYYTGYEDNDLNLYLLDSDTEILTSEQLVKLTSEELNFAYNEIFARHGHDFKNKELKEYFAGQIWYRPVSGRSVSIDSLSEIERENIAIIKEEINLRKK